MRISSWLVTSVVVLGLSCRDTSVPPPPSMQTFITGRVVVAVPGTDQSKPVQGATLKVINSNLAIQTDALGGFTVGPLPEGSYQLYAEARGEGDSVQQRLVSGVSTTRGATRGLGDVWLAQNAQLSGRVLINNQAAGSEGVVVYLPGTDFVTASGSEGKFLLRNLPAGTVRAAAWRSGFTPASTSDIDLQGGVIVSAADLLLQPEPTSGARGTIAGKVVVMGDVQVSAVVVKAWGGSPLKVVAQVQADASGAFRLLDLPSDLYTITAEVAGYAEARVPNVAVGTGVSLELGSPIVLSPPGPTNTPADAGIGFSVPPAGGGSGATGGGSGSTGGGSGTTGGGSGTTGGGGGVQVDAGTCFTTADCPSGLVCASGACVPCSASATCQPGFSCHAGACLKDCATNAACADGQVCRGGSCATCVSSAECQDAALVCVAGACTHCQNRSQCPSGKACLATGCGDCSQDADCGSGALCEAGVCVTGNCHTNNGCPGAQACISHVCQGCGQDTDCRAGQLCLAGACTAGNCRDASACLAGQLCTNHLCGACPSDTACGAGNLCLNTPNGLRCQPGVCRTNADCTGADQGKVCNGTNQCVPCGTTADCADATKVCDATTSRCVPGNCARASDCTALGFSGYLCTANTCTPCTLDGQCGTGQLCLSGRCKTATCKDNSWCSSGTQLCELTTTNPVAAQYTCRPCAPLATINSADCGGTNRVCTAQGFCKVGTCVTQAQCTNGLACLGNTCASCSVDGDCGGGGLLCVNAKCVTGNCHGTAPDANADCPPNQVCMSNVCIGNCRSNADCAGTVPNPGTNYCDLSTHACAVCTSSAQCGAPASGKVCGSGACVPGLCTNPGTTPNDTPCGTGLACVANQCVQAGPLPVTSTPYTEATPITGQASIVVSGHSQLYLTDNDSSGSFSLALDGARNKVWRVSDSAGNGRPFGPWNGGLVVPAPGFPQDELFVTVTGTNGNNVVAHRADNGAQVWTIGGTTASGAVSMVGGMPQYARTEGNGVTLMRTDGTKVRSVGAPACGQNWVGLVGGTKWVYALCYDAIYAIDPLNDVVAWVYSRPLSSNSTSYASLYRPPGATGDLLVVAAVGGVGSLQAFFIPDTAAGSGDVVLRINSTLFGSPAGPPVIDATGNLYLYTSTNKLRKIALADGSLLAETSLPLAPSTLNLAGDGTLVIAYPLSGQYGLAGLGLANGFDGGTIKWTTGQFASLLFGPNWPAFSTVPLRLPDGGVYDGGVLDTISSGSVGVLNQVAGFGLPGPSMVQAWPQWGVNGDPSGSYTAPAYDCKSTADCGPTQVCALGRCIGSCRNATTCAPGQGCTLAQCASCAVDTSCRTGEVCNAGVCVACDRGSDPTCCSTNAECSGGGCVQGHCRPTPNLSGGSTWQKPLTTPTGGTWNTVVGTDGTLYVFEPNNTAIVHAYSPAGTPLWTSAGTPSANYNQSALPLLVRVSGQDVLFVVSSTTNVLYTAVVSSAAFGGWKSVSMSPINNSVTPSLAQGVSSATGAAAPTIFASGASSSGFTKLWAFDAAAAAAGTFTLLWQQPNVGCTESSAVGNWVLVGSDSTVYHVCVDGSVQAFTADGVTSSPIGVGRLGVPLWTSTPSSTFTPGVRPGLGKVPAAATDVLYLPSNGASGSTSLLRVSAAGAASRTELPLSASYAALVDDKGNGYLLGTNSNLAVVSPTGQVLANLGTNYWYANQNMLLTNDGLLWWVDTHNPQQLVATQLGAPDRPTEAFRILGQGNLPFDSTSTLTFLPGSLTSGAGPLLVLDSVFTTLGQTQRQLFGVPLSAGSTTVTQWGQPAGGPQHRASLKTQ